jgi:hypothetical protein
MRPGCPSRASRRASMRTVRCPRRGRSTGLSASTGSPSLDERVGLLRQALHREQPAGNPLQALPFRFCRHHLEGAVESRVGPDHPQLSVEQQHGLWRMVLMTPSERSFASRASASASVRAVMMVKVMTTPSITFSLVR